MRVIALDTETTGLDLRHGCRPFLVTIAYRDEQTNKLTNRHWRWDVNPRSREIVTNTHKYREDVEQIRQEIDNADAIVMQNAKFDITALAQSGIISLRKYWHKVQDTLCASHILSSNTSHNLTALALEYLNIGIKKYEDAVEDAVKKCRNRCRFYYKDWAVAKEGMCQIPSAKGSSSKDDEKGGLWSNDLWLPYALAAEQHYPPDHEYYHVLENYANVDSSVTLLLWTGDGRKWHGMESELKERNLWPIYEVKRELIRILYSMEDRGMTICSERTEQLIEEYKEIVNTLNEKCIDIAARFNYNLIMPKGASPNESLRTFILQVLKLPPQYNEKAKSDAPTLNKDAMGYYLSNLPPNSLELEFVESLLEKRQKDTQLNYLYDYKRFWKPVKKYYDDSDPAEALAEVMDESPQEWYTIHTHKNPTGTATTRLSSNSPNLENVSTKEDEDGRSLRYCFGPMPGREWWDCDASNIELRIPAYEAGEEEMIKIFEDPDKPPYFGSYHLLIAHQVFPKEFEKVSILPDGTLDGRLFKKDELQLYKRTKNGDLADQYGAINRTDRMGTADRAFGVMGAQSKIEKRFPKKAAHNHRCIAYANKHGYVETIPDKSLNWNGRTPRGYPLLCTRSDWGNIVPTVPMNYRTQGSAGWWLYKAMIRTDSQLQKWQDEGFDAFLTMTVHDSLVFDLPYAPDKGNLPRVRLLQQLMEQGGLDIGVPTPVSISYCENNWANGEQIK